MYGRTYVILYFDPRVFVLVMWSAPGYTLTIRPYGQECTNRSMSLSSTKSPTFTDRSDRRHLFNLCKVHRYSFDQRVQKSAQILWQRFQCFKQLIFEYKCDSTGTALRALPMRK